MRILAIDLGPGRRGGQRQTLLVSAEFARSGATVAIAARAGSPLATEAALVDSVRVLPVRAGSEASPGVLLDVARASHGFRPDVLWAGDARGHGAAVWSRIHRHVPLVVHRRVIFPPRRHPLSALKYGAARRFIAVSQAVADVLTAWRIPPEKVAVVPDGLPAAAFVSRPSPEAPPYRLIHAGAFDGKKGQTLAVEVLSRLEGNGVDATLTFLGDGPERPAVERTAASLGVAGRCAFKGEVTDIASELALSHVLLLPSESEGASLVLVEAMAAGCPVMSHDVGGASELTLGGRAGQLLSNLDVGRWTNEVERLLRDPEERARLAAEGRVAASGRTLERTARLLLAELSAVAGTG